MEEKSQMNECENLFVGWKVKIQFENKQMFQGVGPHSNPAALTVL